MAELAQVIHFGEARDRILRRREEERAAIEEARKANLQFEVSLNIVPTSRPRLIIRSEKYGSHNIPLGASGCVKIDEVFQTFGSLGWDGTYVWASDFAQLLSGATVSVRVKIIQALEDLGLTLPWT